MSVNPFLLVKCKAESLTEIQTCVRRVCAWLELEHVDAGMHEIHGLVAAYEESWNIWKSVPPTGSQEGWFYVDMGNIHLGDPAHIQVEKILLSSPYVIELRDGSSACDGSSLVTSATITDLEQWYPQAPEGER